MKNIKHAMEELETICVESFVIELEALRICPELFKKHFGYEMKPELHMNTMYFGIIPVIPGEQGMMYFKPKRPRT